MKNNRLDEVKSISSMEEVDEGDALYLQVNQTVYWITSISNERVSLINKDGQVRQFGRNAFQKSLNEHTWVLQSKSLAANKTSRLESEE